VMKEVDAWLLGAGKYPGYEQYWSANERPSRHVHPSGHAGPH
jgi:hypothetical protein